MLLVLAGLCLATTNPADGCVRRLDDAKPVVSQRPFRWADFAKEWHEAVEILLYTANAEKNGRKALLPSYQVAVANGDTRIKGLEELGFDFKDIGEGYVGVPTLFEVVTRYRQKTRAAVQAGKISATSVLDAGVLVRNKQGEKIPLRFGEDRDDVYLSDVSGRPSDFTHLMAHNVFPISANARAVHELFHMRGLAEDFDYMAGIHGLAVEFAKGGGALPLRDKYVRFFFAYEGLAVLKPEKLSELEPHLIVPLKQWPRVGRASLIFSLANAQSEEKIVHDARALDLFCQKHVTFLGGAGEIGVSYSDPELADSIPALMRNLRRSLNHYDGKKASLSPEELRRVVARVAVNRSRLESAVVYSSELDMKSFFKDLVVWHPPESSGLYRYGVNSGVGTTGQVLPGGGHKGLFLLSLLGELDASHEPLLGYQFKRAR